MQELEKRIAKLEIQNRWFKRIGATLVVVAGVAFISGQRRTDDIVEARTFVLKDSAGTVRAMLSTTTEGGALFSLRDKDERGRIGLLVKANGQSELALLTKNGKVRSLWAMYPNGKVMFALNDEVEQPRGVWELLPNGEITLTLGDKRGRPRGIWKLSDEIKLELHGSDDESGLIMSMAKGEPSVMLLRDGNARGLWMTLNGKPILQMYDQEGNAVFSAP